MFLTIHLQKEVPDTIIGQALFTFVIDKLKDYPEVKITGSVSETLHLPEQPE